MSKLKYINQEVFGTSFGIAFSLPTAPELFLQYIAPTINNSSNPAISIGMGLISIFVFILSWVGLFDIIIKYYKMRGIITDKHIRNMILAMLFGSISGLIVNAVVF